MVTATTEQGVLLTIGYEGLDLPRFIKHLRWNKVTVLVDVRELAFSRKKGFSKSALSDGLSHAGIQYTHLRALGSPRNVRKKLYADRDYEAFFDSYGEHLDDQDDALAALEQLVHEHGRVCIMCFEQDHTECHRSHLAAHLAKKTGRRIQVHHINTSV